MTSAKLSVEIILSKGFANTLRVFAIGFLFVCLYFYFFIFYFFALRIQFYSLQFFVNPTGNAIISVF